MDDNEYTHTPSTPSIQTYKNEMKIHLNEQILKQVFGTYFKDSAGGWLLPIALIFVSILTQACTNAFDLWLSYWSDQYLVNGTVRAVGFRY